MLLYATYNNTATAQFKMKVNIFIVLKNIVCLRQGSVSSYTVFFLTLNQIPTRTHLSDATLDPLRFKVITLKDYKCCHRKYLGGEN